MVVLELIKVHVSKLRNEVVVVTGGVIGKLSAPCGTALLEVDRVGRGDGGSDSTCLLREVLPQKVAEKSLIKLCSPDVDPFAVDDLELWAGLVVLRDVELHVCSLFVGHMRIYDRVAELVYTLKSGLMSALTLDSYIRVTSLLRAWRSKRLGVLTHRSSSPECGEALGAHRAAGFEKA